MSAVLMVILSFYSYINYTQAMMTLSILLPLCMSLLHKNSVYHEDGWSSLGNVGVLLAFLTLSLMILVLLVSAESKSNYYLVLQMGLVLALLMCFTIKNLLSFYILFEASLIPILLMIIHWGYQPERLQAGSYMVMYTVISSLPLLGMILYMNYLYMTYHLCWLRLFNSTSSLLLLGGLLAFLVKLPAYGGHIWLPKAHVEAPLGGSMILAGVLLKLGGYGMYLFASLFYTTCNTPVSWLVCMLVLWGGVLSSFVCIIQTDIKAFIAYSSIVHMSLIPMGVLSGSSWGLSSAIIIMLAHGWASSALFLCAFSTYEMVGSRSFLYTKGMLMVVPVLSMFWFLYGAINMGFPPTINFLGELLFIPVSFMYSWVIYLLVGIVMFMSVTYNMYLYVKINHGLISSYFISSVPLTGRSLLGLVGHALPLSLTLHLGLLTNICK